jgi:hypothetical protein
MENNAIINSSNNNQKHIHKSISGAQKYSLKSYFKNYGAENWDC